MGSAGDLQTFESEGKSIDELLEELEQSFSAGELDHARALCLRILAQQPKNHKAMVTMSVIQARTGKMEVARETLESALVETPNCPYALNWYVSILREQKDYVKAIETCRRVLEITPRDPESHNNFGLTLLAAGRFEEAARSFAEAERLDGGKLAYYHNLVVVHKYRGSVLEAEATLRRGLARWPNDPLLNAGLGEILFERGETEAAIPYFRLAVVNDDQSLSFKVALAQALALTLRFDEAEELSRKILEIDPNQARAHAVTGSILQHRGKFAEAEIFLQRAIELEPGLAGAYFELVYCRKIQPADVGMLEKIEELIQAPNLSSQDRMVLHYAMGKGLDDLGEYSRAIGFFDEANKIAFANSKNAKNFRIDGLRSIVDKNIARYDANFFQRHRDRGLEDNTPIFVIGMMRSGSTLVEQILSSHPSVGAAGELMFWPERTGDMDMGKPGFSFEKVREHAQDYIKFLQRSAPGALRVTDKMTDNVLLLGMLTTLFPNARFICCRRHPAGHCLSLYLTPFRYSQAYLHDKENIAAAYKQYARMEDHWKQVVPKDRYMEVWYGDVVEDRDRLAREMIAFCGLEWSDACLQHEKNERIVITASKWQARQPIYKTSTERWLQYRPWIKPFTDLLDESEDLAA